MLDRRRHDVAARSPQRDALDREGLAGFLSRAMPSDRIADPPLEEGAHAPRTRGSTGANPEPR